MHLSYEISFLTGICAAYHWEAGSCGTSLQSLITLLFDFDDGFDQIADSAYMILGIHPNTVASRKLDEHLDSIAEIANRPLSGGLDALDDRTYHAQLMECYKAMMHYGALCGTRHLHASASIP